jgi:hypothetical protein
LRELRPEVGEYLVGRCRLNQPGIQFSTSALNFFEPTVAESNPDFETGDVMRFNYSRQHVSESTVNSVRKGSDEFSGFSNSAMTKTGVSKRLRNSKFMPYTTPRSGDISNPAPVEITNADR